MEGPVAVEHDRADAAVVGLGGEQRARRVLRGGGRLHVEARERGARQVAVADRDLAGRRVELGEERAVLGVGGRGVQDGEHRRVLQLARPGVGDRAPVAGGSGEPRVEQVVAVGEAGQEQARVDGRHDAGQAQRP